MKSAVQCRRVSHTNIVIDNFEHSVRHVVGRVRHIRQQQLGDVDEVVIDVAKGDKAVIELENSDKEVAIPVNKLSISADGKKLNTTMTREQLEALPDYDPMDMESAPE
jgi:hypothetical protein